MSEIKELQKQIKVLENLIEQEKNKPNVAWRSSNMVSLYESLANLEKRLKEFKQSVGKK